jgi:hypothetical protein
MPSRSDWAILRTVIPEQNVLELVQAHSRLDEPTTAAIWINPAQSEPLLVKLVEVIPSMADDEKAEQPTYFNPGVAFRFPIAIIAGNLRSLEAALRRNKDFAREVAAGKVLLPGNEGEALVQLARQISHAA